MLDKNAIGIILVTFLFLYVYQYVLLPKWYPPPPSGSKKPGQSQTVPKPPASEKPPVVKAAPGTGQQAQPAGPAITQAIKPPPAKPAPKTPGKETSVKQPAAEPVQAIQVPLKENLVLELPEEKDSSGALQNKLRATFTNQGAALKTLEIMDYDRSATGKEPLPIVRELESGIDSLVLEETTTGIDLAKTNFEVKEYEKGGKNPHILFAARFPGKELVVQKGYALELGQRHLKMMLDLSNLSDTEQEFRFKIRAVGGIPSEDPVCTLVKQKKTASYYTQAFVGRLRSNGSITMEHFAASKVKPGQPKTYQGDPCAFVGCENRYFAVALTAPAEPAGWRRSALFESVGGTNIAVSLESSAIKLNPRETLTYNFLLYAGPKKQEDLESYPDLQAIFSFGFFDSVARPILAILHFFHYGTKHFGGYGLAIILLTLVIRLCLHPLQRKAQFSMHAMSKLSPEMKKLQEKYKDDKQRLNQEMMKLYKEHNASPLGGCLPMFLQFPIFIALYRVIQSSIEIRGHSFLWIKDLSQQDALFCLPFSLPLLRSSAINILPLLMIFLYVYQQKLTPKTNDPQQAQMQKMMTIMPIVFGFMFYPMPSGLLLYFVSSSFLGLFETKSIRKQLDQSGSSPKPTGKIVPKKKRRDKFGRRG